MPTHSLFPQMSMPFQINSLQASETLSSHESMNMQDISAIIREMEAKARVSVEPHSPVIDSHDLAALYRAGKKTPFTTGQVATPVLATTSPMQTLAQYQEAMKEAHRLQEVLALEVQEQRAKEATQIPPAVMIDHLAKENAVLKDRCRRLEHEFMLLKHYMQQPKRRSSSSGSKGDSQRRALQEYLHRAVLSESDPAQPTRIRAGSLPTPFPLHPAFANMHHAHHLGAQTWAHSTPTLTDDSISEAGSEEMEPRPWMLPFSHIPGPFHKGSH